MGTLVGRPESTSEMTKPREVNSPGVSVNTIFLYACLAEPAFAHSSRLIVSEWMHYVWWPVLAYFAVRSRGAVIFTRRA